MNLEETLKLEIDNGTDILDFRGKSLRSFPKIEDRDVEVLLLGDNCLRRIPIRISNLKKLRILDLSGNKGLNLPNKLFDLEFLRELYLGGNEMYDIDPRIGFLQLEKLDLSNNKLTSLPTSLLGIRSLRELDCSNNKLDYFFFLSNSFPELEELNLSANKIKGMSNPFGSENNLKKLDLKDNELKSLPFSLFQNNVELEGNPINDFAKRIREAREHRYMHLDLESKVNTDANNPESVEELGSKLVEFPVEILEMQWLKTLDISNNDIKEIPAEIGRLVNLEELILENNNLENLPKEIADLKKLRIIKISKNPLGKLPTCGFKWNALEKMYASEIEMENLRLHPEDIPNLELLDISGNPIGDGEGIPNELFQLNLKYLLASKCGLKGTDEGEGELKGLIKLDLSTNDFTRIPPFVKKLAKLEILNLGENALLEEFEFSRNELRSVKEIILKDNSILEHITNCFTEHHNLEYIDGRGIITERPTSLDKLKGLKTDLWDNNSEDEDIGEVFICYSKKDEEYASNLKTHLISHMGVVDVHGAELGDEVELYIERSIKKAKIAVLLLSSDFFTDVQIVTSRKLIEAKKNKMTILPIQIRSCDISEESYITKLQPVHTFINNKEFLENQDAIWTKTSKRIKELLKKEKLK